MKKQILILMTALAALSCTDYLNVKPRGYDIPTTLDQYTGLIYGKEYAYMDEVFEYMAFEFAADADGFSNAYANMGRAKSRAFCWEKDIFLPDENCGEWNSPTSFLYGLNVTIAEVMDASDGTEKERLAVQSEARMLRAWLHFMMAQNFGKPYDAATAASDRCIPIITTASTIDASFPMHTVKEVYDFILTEMEEAIPNLSEEPEHFSRVFRATGEAMLGKVLWMTGRYEEAEPILADALQHALAQGCSLLDFNTLLTEDGNLTYPTDWVQNPEYLFLIDAMPRLWLAVYTTYYNSAIFTIREDVLFHYFKAGDLRLTQLTGVRSGKTAYTSFKPGDQYSANINNMITNLGLSLPDVYLMYAEVLARNGKTSEAASLLEEFRSKRMDPAKASVTEPDLVVAAVEERMREYIGFGNSWYDTRRLWNDPKFQYMKSYYTRTDGTNTYTLTEDRLTMEIPPVVLSWHPEYSTQQ